MRWGDPPPVRRMRLWVGLVTTTGVLFPLTFQVAGMPAPQGSKKIVHRHGKAFLVDDNDGAKQAWRAAVVAACTRSYGRAAVTGGGAMSQPATVTRETPGWSDCGHNAWRPGHVLDPFGGSGTTAVAATGLGRDCTLIDIDARNADLAQERVGMFLEVTR